VWGIILGASTFGYILGNVTAIMESFNVEVSKTGSCELALSTGSVGFARLLHAAECMICMHTRLLLVVMSVYTAACMHVHTVDRYTIYTHNC
jgi:hypothetical protein